MNGHPNDNDKTGSRRSLKSLVQWREKEKGIRSEEMTTGLKMCLKPQVYFLKFITFIVQLEVGKNKTCKIDIN